MIERVLLKTWTCFIFAGFVLCFLANVNCNWLEKIQITSPDSEKQSDGDSNPVSTTPGPPESYSQGVLRKCKFVGDNQTEDVSTLDIMLSTPPSAFWKVSAITLSIATTFGGISCFFALIMLISCAKCTDEIITRIQQVITIINVSLQIIAMITFMAGLDNDETSGNCGKGLGPFSPGDCTFGGAIDWMIISICLSLAGLTLSFIVCAISKVRSYKDTASKGLKLAGLKSSDSGDGKGKKKREKREQQNRDAEKRGMDQLTDQEKEEMIQEMSRNPEVAQFLSLLANSSQQTSKT